MQIRSQCHKIGRFKLKSPERYSQMSVRTQK
jgi:hypothetical protein